MMLVSPSEKGVNPSGLNVCRGFLRVLSRQGRRQEAVRRITNVQSRMDEGKDQVAKSGFVHIERPSLTPIASPPTRRCAVEDSGGVLGD
jgi:hypothetical protein